MPDDGDGESSVSQEKDQVLTVMQAVVDAWNKPRTSHFDPGLTIVDNTPPYLFQGKDAQEKWVKAYEASQASSVAPSQTSLRLLAPLTTEVTGGVAYIALPAEWAITRNGHSDVLQGVVTATMTKSPSGWRITAWIWTPR